MKYNKKYLYLDNNGIAHPQPDVYLHKYHYQIVSIFENQNIDKLSFWLDGYIITIFSKDLKITKEKKFRNDGSMYWLIFSEFNSGGHLAEFLAFFDQDQEVWLECPDIHFEKINN